MGKRARNSNRRVKDKDKGSDDSDEDYVISDEEEEEEEEEEYEEAVDLNEFDDCCDLKEYEDSFDGCDVSDAVEDDDGFNEVEEEEDVMLRNVEWPKVKTGPRGNRKITGCKSRKMEQVVASENDDVDLDDADDEEIGESRNDVGIVKAGSLDGIGLGKRRRVFYDVEDEDEDEDEDGDYQDEHGKEEGEEREVEDVSCEKVDLDSGHNGEDGEMKLEEQDNVSHETEKEDDGDYDEDEDGDTEYTADEEDVSLDEEEEEETIAKSPARNKRKQRSRGGRKRRKKGSVAKTRLTSGRKRRGNKTKEDEDDDDGDFVDDCLPARKKLKTRSSRPRRRCTVPSDSDIASSGESNYEYTISEEEREQVREASSLLRSSVKHVSSIRKTTVVKDLPQSRKSPVKKVEKKVELVKRDVLKNICGICLSEEDMRRLKGTLDCCSHYFCFTCIMEWSKVESRCPLCKQRFRTISKPARSTPGVDLREVLIPVPERDQVYQPTEEELRSYLDPYENIICSECHQGEDDGLMLLCDLCDSSAHTYCVGLGREVPEGNWYCESCRPVAIGPASSQTHTTSEQQRVSGFYSRPPPVVVSGQYQDPSLLVSPRTPFSNGEYLFSSRLPNSDVQSSSPSGLGATTLSRRRTLHRHIQNIINSDRLINMGNRAGGTSMIANSSYSSDGFVTTQIGHGREREAPQPSLQTGTPLYTISEDRLPNNSPLFSAHDTELLSSRLNHFGSEQAVGRFSNNTFLGDQPIDLGLHHGVAQGDPMFANQQHLRNYTPNTMPSTGGEQLQHRVNAHLKNLSRQINLGQATFDEISTCSLHTILAACGLEHKSSEVHLVPPPVTCLHDDMRPCSSSSSNNSSLMKGCCYSCFDSFVEDVVKMILDTRQPHWLRLGLH